MVSAMAHRSIGQLVAERPSRAIILEAFAIDYCCHGTLPLAEACEARQINLQNVLQALRAEGASQLPSPVNEVDWRAARLTDLVEHIQVRHHSYLRAQLVQLGSLAGKVVAAHRKSNPELRLLQRFLNAFASNVVPHMLKEEYVVFPAIRRCEAGEHRGAAATEELRKSIGLMEDEHDIVGVHLRAMRELTDDYRPPEEACLSWRALFSGLADLEADMHMHLHKENNILFPRALAHPWFESLCSKWRTRLLA